MKSKCNRKSTITHWRFLLENRRDTANFRTARERHKIWRFCFQFHGTTAVVRQDTLSCAHLRQQYDQEWSSGGSDAALVRKPHALSRLHDVQSRCAAFVGAHIRCTHVHWRPSALRHHHSRSLAEARHFLALTHDTRAPRALGNIRRPNWEYVLNTSKSMSPNYNCI